MTNTILTRQDAKATGAKHYFTGLPCPRGHIAPRFTSVGTCTACSREKAMEAYVHTTSRRRAYSNGLGFIQAAREVHGGTYLYDASSYKGAHTPLPITCQVHGQFWQSPTNHIQGKGCPQCAAALVGAKCTKTTEEFVREAQAYWRGAYSYEAVVYRGSHAKVEITCRKHGGFLQTPTNHLTGKAGCPRCNHMKSKAEDDVFAHLAKLTPAVQRDRTLIKPKELDIYLPEKSLAVEYCGMYWHSLFSAEEVKAKKDWHSTKHQECAAKGVRLITIYEAEWLEHTYAIKRLLRNAIGRGRGKLMARKCELRKVVHAEAVAFYDRYHPQGGAGNGDHYGLYWKGKLVACMRFNLGANDRGAAAADRVWTLTRYATRITVAGGASRLFKAFLAEYRPSVVKSFSDNRYFDGGMYEKLGFTLESTSAPDYQVWSPKIGLRPKTHYQRRVLPQRLQDHEMEETFDPATDTRTEAEMTFLMRCGRIYDCGKKRWVWTAPSAA